MQRTLNDPELVRREFETDERYASGFSVLGTEPARRIDDLPEPFRATTRNSVFVAEKAS